MRDCSRSPSIRLRVLLLLLAGTLTACAARYPVALLHADAQETTTVTPTDTAPLVTLVPHADGLGWTAVVQEWTTVHITRQTRFTWGGLVFSEYSFNLFGNLFPAFVCPYTIPLAIIHAIGAPREPAFATPIAICSRVLGARPETTTYHESDPHPVTLTTWQLRPVPEGTLVLRFPHAHAGFFSASWTPDDQGRLPIRLPALTPHDVTPAIRREPVLLDVHIPGRPSVTRPLPLTVGQLSALVRQPDRPPTGLTPPLRIVTQDPALTPIAHRLTAAVLRAGHPVIVDPEDAAALQATQADLHRGPFAETPAIAPGHATAARTLIVLATHGEPPQTLATLKAFDLAGGTLRLALILDPTPSSMDPIIDAVLAAVSP